MPRPVMVVMGRHRPHQLLFLAFSAVWGVAFLVGAPPPTSLAALMPPWVIRTWAGGLLLSGAVGLVGVLTIRRHVVRGLLVEQGAMLIGAAALLLFAVAAFQYAGWRAGFAGGLVLAWAAANLWRAEQIRRELRRVPR